jgi:hypothetical protein
MDRNDVSVGLDVIAAETVTVSSTAIGITAALLGSPIKTWARLYNRDNDINYTVDGTDPTATTGIPLQAGASVEISGRNNLNRLQMIRASADSAVYVELGRN